MFTGKLVFATNNLHKLQEAVHILTPAVQLLSLNDIGCFDALPETHPTLEENAAEKALWVYSKYNVNCFAEDTGLEVDALNGAPGVYSARYAGVGKSSRDNIRLLLERMKNIANRKARFRAVIALIMNGNQYLFEGVVNGQILPEPQGEKGFGYDSVFQPEGFAVSFARMSIAEKSRISHRKKALDRLAEFLRRC
ncbi:MAG TPA: RdgB/HAM1 family non-canonical purine NTP pyrophosphatase [Chitinophagales bacterium]|nr:RdgB/HAM1 family non-canonical purine NTP pyrophosphatase [Chitinophagales bacterium]